jgi:hypothetical protein
MSVVHVVPVNDLREHTETGADCWCEPRVLDEGTDPAGEPARVIVHSSADGRERWEDCRS